MAYLLVYSSILSLFVFFPSCLQAQFVILSEPDDVVYVEAGQDLRLDVRFSNTGAFGVSVSWNFNGSTLLFRNYGTNVQEQISLTINNTSLRNNGTYSLVWVGSSSDRRDYVVIIQVQPVCNITCAPPFQISEGENFSCGCLGVAGSPPPSASWFKDSTRIGSVGHLQKQLYLFNVNKDSAGTYICRAQSGTLTCEKSINLTVFYKPTNVSFTSNTTSNIATLGDNVNLACVADGNHSPNYTITFNKTEVQNVRGILIIKNASYDDVGTYRCDAKNSLGNLSKQLFLNVKEARVTTNMPSTSANTASTPAISTDTSTTDTSTSSSTTTFERSGQCDEGTEWYIIFITFICGTIFGAAIMYLIMFYLGRRRKARHHDKHSKPGKASNQGGLGEKLENAPTYQELDLRKMRNEGDNYQALTEMSKTDPRKKTNYENEVADYEELNKVRENDDGNYQSLRRA